MTYIIPLLALFVLILFLMGIFYADYWRDLD